MKCPCKWFNAARRALLSDLGRLVLRLYFGGAMLLAHGWGKMMAFSEKKDSFPDPLGVGNIASLSMTISAEVGCAALILLGVMTRLATLPLMFAMGVAFFVIHGGEPFKRKELALVYLCGYIAILLLGPGRFSIDHLIWGKKLDHQLSPADTDSETGEDE